MFIVGIRLDITVILMVIEKILYSRKMISLLLFLLYIDIAYVSAVFNRDALIYGTIVSVIILGYLAYYSHSHRSAKEVLALTVFTSLALILGLITGIIFGGYNDIGASMYALTMAISILLILYFANRIYRI
ncbi:hypothetical protein Shell_0044 [Staphylothermus hellenicus DSM 12710]|uniref:Uncharacterized protein n=2 Tax=Staphylothermus hellenicus TaxID=84599 RepID=D7DAJ7_STAHD|nr:hypothetical protein Shell_0044 [Staphylothermus hellenicus DSM 12710]